MNIGNRWLRSELFLRVVGAVALLGGLLAWALASPVGASPDEDYHLASIWCAQGERTGVCEDTAAADSVEVPEGLVGATCYAFNAAVSAQCQTDGFAQPGDEMKVTDRWNYSGAYPPVYYAAMGIFVGEDISTSVIVMRAVNALLYVVFVAALYIALPVGLRRAMITAAMVTAIPFGVFLVPSINPSGWALLSGTTTLIAVLGYITADDATRRRWLGGLAALAVLFGAGSRADAAMYAVIAVVGASVLAWRGGAAYLRRLVFPAVLAVVSGASFLSSGQSGAVTQTNGQDVTLGYVVNLLMGVPSLWTGAFGQWGLGWLDTAMPALVWVGSWTVFAGVLFVSVRRGDPRRTLASLMIAAAVWLVPAYVLYASGVGVGVGVQPRYILPLVIMLAAATMTRLGSGALVLDPQVRWIVVLTLAVCNSAALHTNLRRYVTGVDKPTLNLNHELEWWWGTPGGPLALWIVGSAAFAVGLVLLTRELVRPAPALSTSSGWHLRRTAQEATSAGISESADMTREGEASPA